MKLRPFQRRAVKALESGDFDTVAMCLPRAQGKSTLAAHLCFRALTPGDPLFVEGTESHLVAATIGSSRKTCFKLLRKMIEDSPKAGDYKISESANACHVRHTLTNTRVSVIAGSARATLGLVGCPLVVVDEPGSYELEAGGDLWASLLTAQGKPDSPLRLFLIGHLAPRATRAGHWYFDLIHRGTRNRTWVYFLQGNRERWDKAAEIRRCSPLSWGFKASRAKLLELRDDARRDSLLLAAFLSFRLNLPAADEARVLLTTRDYQRIVSRPVPGAEGRPLVGVDLGSGRAWSSAVAVYHNGRVECIAIAPGVPSIEKQERRDDVPVGTYARLVAEGSLHVAEGLQVPPAKLLMSHVAPWMPRAILCDRHRLEELQDCRGKVPIIPRIPRWSNSTNDIRALRRLARDGALAVEPSSRALLKASLSVTMVENDDAGGTRMVKRGTNNKARDDVSAALILAAGAVARTKPRRKSAVVVCGKVS